MGLQLSLSDAKELGENVWRTEIAPQQVRSLDSTAKDVGEVSVLAVLEPVRRLGADAIQFDPTAVRVLAVGSTPSTLILQSCADVANNPDKGSEQDVVKSPPTAAHIGDEEFMRELRNQPEDVRELGRAFIIEVRQHFPGRLKPSDSGRFIETPDNFWTVKLQPRDRSLSITVRGRLDQLPSPEGIDMKRDRPAYSRFKIERKDQIPGAIDILRRAPRRGA